MTCKLYLILFNALQNKFPTVSKASRSQARFRISMAGWFQLSSWGLVGWWGNKGWTTPKSECKENWAARPASPHSHILYCKTLIRFLFTFMRCEDEERNGLNTHLSSVVAKTPTGKVAFEQTQYRSDWVSHVDIWGKSALITGENKGQGAERGACSGCVKSSEEAGVARAEWAWAGVFGDEVREITGD